MKRAFSLLELLVVIVILSMLAALIFPVLARAKQQANATQCISNLRQMGVAIQAYQADNNGELPVGTIKRWRNSMGDGTLSEEHSTRDVVQPLRAYGISAIEGCPQMSHLPYTPRWIRNFGAPVNESRMLVPLPSTVLIECHRHLTKGWSGSTGSETYTVAPASARSGKHLVLHADGSVGKADAGSVRQFTYRFVGGKDQWVPLDLSGPAGEGLVDVFPEETWPPEWTRLPEMVELNWGYGG